MTIKPLKKQKNKNVIIQILYKLPQNGLNLQRQIITACIAAGVVFRCCILKNCVPYFPGWQKKTGTYSISNSFIRQDNFIFVAHFIHKHNPKCIKYINKSIFDQMSSSPQFLTWSCFNFASMFASISTEIIHLYHNRESCHTQHTFSI